MNRRHWFFIHLILLLAFTCWLTGCAWGDEAMRLSVPYRPTVPFVQESTVPVPSDIRIDADILAWEKGRSTWAPNIYELQTLRELQKMTRDKEAKQPQSSYVATMDYGIHVKRGCLATCAPPPCPRSIECDEDLCK